MKSRKEIAKQARASIGYGMSRQHQNTRECQAFYAGDFMEYKDTVQFVDRKTQRKKRAIVQINHVKPYVNAVKGFFAQNRRKAKYTAKMSAGIQQVYYTINANALSDYLRENCNANQVETQQNGDMLINGYGAVETCLTYGQGYATTDPNGELSMMRLDPNCVGWDRYARQTNVTDARDIWYKQEYRLDEALELFDDADESDFQAADGDWDDDYTRYNWIGDHCEYASEEDNRIKVWFYQWYEVETFYRCENPVNTLTNPISIEFAQMALEQIASELTEDDTNGLFVFNPEAPILTFDKKLKKRMEETFGEFIEVFDYKRKVFYKAVLSGDVVLTAALAESQQGHSIKIKTGDFDEKNKIWVGMVNSMMEPAKYYNKALTELIFTIAANSKGGVMYEKGSIEDIEEFNENYAKTDTSVEVAEGALVGGKIKPKQNPLMPTGLDSIIQIADAALPQSVGIDKTFLGSSENRMETAQLQRQRIKQVSSSLACYVDSETLYQKDQARLVLDLMRIYAENNDGALFRVIEENGREDFIPISKDKLNAEYEVSIVEAQQTIEEKQENAQILIQLAQAQAVSGNIPAANAIYAVAFKSLPIDKEDIIKITEAIQPQDNQIDPSFVEQIQAELATYKDQTNQALIEKTMAETENARARAELTLANVAAIRAKAPLTDAQTVKTLEEAKRTAAEVDAVAYAPIDSISVTI